ncbi:secretion/DNA translocation related CpaE-like protein [Arthrobacter sp. V4I6]|uniref:septum site-determining protein Ssd n=1 Tax=unclassified Arthrobacter TaxID=235627 RepID=UPI00277D9549|nr:MULTISPECIES: septum site-determining protein Ssd [unclassified Arthrobacter]MDQ0819698.1 secretion/DNA translocation related CpaE-like protein [Arthrobacter sp. V1I7]MDQ0853879.1 secretion/DNA translocation related CpaE-like protein [Arthrobacter sp. V4I6]
MSRHELFPPDTPRRRGAGPGEAAWLPDASAETLLVTANELLHGEVERIVAAAGGTLRTVPDVLEAAPFWAAAAAVLVGNDITALPPRRRAPAVLLGLADDGDSLWQLAAAIGAERVAVLPEASAWLAAHLSRSRSPAAGGLVLGISGGCGGAGATTAAIWLAQAAARHGADVLLVDGDPRGGGLELALGAEETPGLRWPDLAGASGSIDPGQLAESLPTAGGFSFLSWPGSRDGATVVETATVSIVLEAARRGFDLVVLDIGRGSESLRALAWDCDRLVLIVPAQLRAAVATARLLHDLPPVETSLVVRGKPGAVLDGGLIADSVGLPLSGIMPEVRGTAAATELGRLLISGQQRIVRRFAAAVLELSVGEVR